MSRLMKSNISMAKKKTIINMEKIRQQVNKITSVMARIHCLKCSKRTSTRTNNSNNKIQSSKIKAGTRSSQEEGEK